MKIVVLGASGRMGRTVARLAAAAGDVRILAGITSGGGGATAAEESGYPALLRPADAATVVAEADVVLDFSTPAALDELIAAAGERLRGKALVVGTTGLGPAQLTRLEELSKEAAVLIAANFSVGVNVLLSLVERAAEALPAASYDAEVVESHHRDKADAPSGTALELARAIARAREVDLDGVRRDGRTGRTGARPTGEIGLHALRGGGVAGEHRVLFLGERERIELGHAAHDRSLFAEGALHACRWMAGRPPGRYRMADVLGL